MAADSLPTPTTSLLADQRSRWDRGERPPVEHYLKRQPALNDNTEVLLDLIYAEVVLRREAGEEPKADEYVVRFPGLEEPIRTQFEVDAAIDDDATQLGDTDRIGPDYLTTPPRTPPGYELLEQLGHGGMGVVFKARQIGLDRLVAIKMIRSGELADPLERARFDAEARAVARLSHPNIIQIFEVGQTESGPFLVLEYVPGNSLADALRDSPYPPRQAASLLVTLARAIDHAHQSGIVHRDLKPANILLVEPGNETTHTSGVQTVKITDFGLAKRLGSDKLTRTGDFLGTPNFAAPEQAAGKVDVGPPADVYSLGAILYQMLTGRPPFAGATPLETLDLVRFSEPVSPSRLRPNVPRDLETIAVHCLNKDPAKRYASAAALADDLERFLNNQPIYARPVSPIGRGFRWCRRHPAMAGMMAAVVLVIVASFVTVTSLWRSAAQARDSEAQARSDEQVQHSRANSSAAEVLIANARHALMTNDLALAKRTLAECPADYRNSDWKAVHRVCEASRLLVPPGRFAIDAIAFDPHGRSIAGSMSTGRLLCWDASSGKETVAISLIGKSPVALAFDSDGYIVAGINTYVSETGFARRDSLEFAGFDTSTGKQIWQTKPIDRPLRCELSRDGTRAIVIPQRSRRAEILDVRTANLRYHVETKSNAMVRASFSTNGHYFISAGTVNDVSVWDAENGFLLRKLNEPGTFIGSVAVAITNDVEHAAIGASSGLKPGEILLMHNQRESNRLLSQFANISGLVFDPSGKWLAGFSNSESTIRVWDVQTGREEIVFRGHDSVVRCMTFNADGTQIVAGYRDGRIVVWTLAARDSP